MTTIEKIEKGIITLAEFTEDQQSFIRGIVKLSFNEGQEQALRIHDVSGALGFDKGYEQGYNDATMEACQEIAKNYQPNDR